MNAEPRLKYMSSERDLLSDGLRLGSLIIEVSANEVVGLLGCSL